MRIHFAAAIEAIPRHCNMARLWAFSIRRFGGEFADSDISVVFNERSHEATARLLEQESGVRVSVRPRLSRLSPHANKYNALSADGLDRSDFVLLTDADVACVNDLGPIAAELAGETAFAAAAELHYPELGGGPGSLPVYGYGRMLRSLVPGLSAGDLAKLVHPWFTTDTLPIRYPLFNGGVMCVRSDRVAEFRDRIVLNTEQLWRTMSHRNSNPLRSMANFWNSRVMHSRLLRPLHINWYFPRGFSDQVALLPTALQLKMPYRVLPHAFNWRHTGIGQGDETPRLIHYYQLALGVDVNQILEPDWLDVYARSENPGRRELVKAVGAYLGFTKEGAVK